MSWSIDSYKSRPNAQAVTYDDPAALARATERLREMPPLVTSWEVERLREQIADAQLGKRFLLQGGDCAETLADCTRQIITAKLKILLQMSLVLVHASQAPVIRVGRIAGQYAKPRTEKTEKRDGVELPSFFGDSVNAAEFTAAARRPDPARMIAAYQHAGLTINFIRSLVAAGFADVTHPEYWDLGFKDAVPGDVRAEYEAKARSLAEALRFMAALGERTFSELARVEFFTSHEALHLEYEAAQTANVPRRTGHYLLSTHFPWIGERTRDPKGAHVEFLRGVRNPIGIKLGPTVRPDDLLALLDAIDPQNEPGRITLITRMGAKNVDALLPIIATVTKAGRRVLWSVDPMHGNTLKTASGRKTRRFDDILLELDRTFDVHEAAGTRLGGVHFELTGENVTECIGGAAGVTESDLDDNYATACDPRLNYRQALEMSFFIAKRLAKDVKADTS